MTKAQLEQLLLTATPQYTSCSECRCWDQREYESDSDHGHCVRLPPLPTRGFPITRGFNGCWMGIKNEIFKG